MKLLAALLLLVGLCHAPALYAQNSPPPPPPPPHAPMGAWETFTLEEGNFSVLLPPSPSKSTQTQNTTIGQIQIYGFSADNGSRNYSVIYTDYPIVFDTYDSAKASLDASRDAILSKSQGQLLEEKEIFFGSYVGRETKIKTGPAVMHAQQYIIRQRIYMLIASLPEADISRSAVAREVARFFESFKLLKEPPAVAANVGSMSKMKESMNHLDAPADLKSRPLAWRDLVVSQYGFKIALPSEPFEKVFSINPSDSRLDIKMWMARGNGFFCQVVAQSFIEVPKDELTRELLFKSLLSSMTSEANGKVSSEKPITFKGHPGRIYSFQVSNLNGSAKAYLIGKTIYLLSTLSTDDGYQGEEANKFFDSFNVLELPAPPQPDPPPPPPPQILPEEPPTLRPELIPQGAIKVSGGVLQGSALKRSQPEYPPIAKAARAEGAVHIQIVVSEEGKVLDAVALRGHPLLRDAALNAARQWEFSPAILGGQSIKMVGILVFNFSLN